MNKEPIATIDLSGLSDSIKQLKEAFGETSKALQQFVNDRNQLSKNKIKETRKYNKETMRAFLNNKK